MAFAKFVEKQIQSRRSMQQDQLGYTPGPEESGIASSFLTGVSMILIVITFPFSLFFCMRMIQVSGRKLHTACTSVILSGLDATVLSCF